MPRSQSRVSTLWYSRHITTLDGTDITADPVYFAFLPRDVRLPTPTDLHTALYQGGNVWGVLIGVDGGDLALDPGTYRVWQKVSDDPETYCEIVDTLIIT